jgi:hypothetical protein
MDYFVTMESSKLGTPAQTTGQITKLLPFAALVLILSVVSALVGYQFGYQNGTSKTTEKVSQQLNRTGIVDTEETADTLKGSVQSIVDSTIVLEVRQMVNNPLSEPAPLERRALVNESTQIIRIVSIPEEEAAELEKKYQADLAAFEKSRPTDEEDAVIRPPAMPVLSREEVVPISDLKPGMMLRVVSDENIFRKESFLATKILVIRDATELEAIMPAETEAPTVE